MSKPIYRRETRLVRRYAKERTLSLASRIIAARFNYHDRIHAQTERMIHAVEAPEFREMFQ